ncbi:2Fe-2S iron-sulfur cluster-binding protein [Roseobacteraceae bacterium S113]
MAHFHPLTVTDVRKTIRDAVVVSLAPQSGDFTFRAGQYLTFKRDFDGTELRRSYSICAAEGDALQVGIKHVEGGAFSSWANEALRPGDVLEAMAPMGQFQTTPAKGQPKHYLTFAGGSGITPVLSILQTVLADEPQARVTLVYANRSQRTIMFREEIEDLKNRHMGRLNVVHVLEQEQDIPLFEGRVDQEKCTALFAHWIDVASVDEALICGPEPMMLAISESLRAHGLDDNQIKFELFKSAQPGRLTRPATLTQAAPPGGVQVRLTVDGTSQSFEMDRDMTLLDAARADGIDAPYACKAGVCSTCKCKILEGEVEMAANHALEDYEVRAGYVLSCQSFAISDKIVASYDV